MADKRERWFISYLPTSMAGSCYDSLLPIFIILVLSGNVGDVALISLIASAATVPSLILWGIMTDSQKHRKSFIVLGYTGRAIAYTIMAASAGIPELALAHVILGLLASASAPAISILILEYFTKDKWCEKIGAFNRVSGVGNILGLLFGIIWIALVPSMVGLAPALRLLFIINALLALAGAWLAHALIVEPTYKVRRESFYGPLMELARWSREKARYLPGRISQFFKPAHLGIMGRLHRGKEDPTGRYLVSTFVYNSGIHSFLTIMPVWILVSLGFNGIGLFTLSLVLISASTLSYAPLGKMLDRANKSRMLSYSILARSFLVFACAFSMTFASFGQWALIAILLIVYVFLGVTWAVIADTQLPIFINIRPGNNQGAKTGVFNAVVGIGHIAGDAIGGILVLTFGFSYAIIISAMLIAMSSAAYLTINSQAGEGAAVVPVTHGH
jgi:MFS family permease